jgi:hypothetical protein
LSIVRNDVCPDAGLAVPGGDEIAPLVNRPCRAFSTSAADTGVDARSSVRPPPAAPGSRGCLDAVPCQCHDGAEFVDGKPLFGKSKTVRGIELAIFSSAVAAPLLWFDWTIERSGAPR